MAPKIAIVGGGPCGLTLARLLHMKNMDFTVFERYPNATHNRQGGSLDIHEHDGQLAMKEAGLYDKFMEKARYEDELFTLLDKHGVSCGTLGDEEPLTPEQVAAAKEKGGGRPEIDRAALHKILLDSVPPNKIQWDRTLKRITTDEASKTRTLEFANGTKASGFDLIVGADGAFSKVRPLIHSAVPKHTGRQYLESRISPDHPKYPEFAARFGCGTQSFLGDGKNILLMRQGDLSYFFYLGFKAPENFNGGVVDLSDTESVRKLLLSDDYFGTWAPIVHELVHNSESFRNWPLYSQQPEEMSWETVPGVTLVGDAAHMAMPSGEGVNMAMLDALKLAEKLEQYGESDLQRAVREYEEEMRVRAKAMIEDAFQMMDLMTHPEAPEIVLTTFQKMHQEAAAAANEA